MKLILLFLVFNFQATAQISFDENGAYSDETLLHELLLSQIENKSTKFKIKRTSRFSDGRTEKLKYLYCVKDSVLHQSCNGQTNMHRLESNNLEYIPNIEDSAEFNKYTRTLIDRFMDSANYQIFNRSRINNEDTVLIYRTTTLVDTNGRPMQKVTNLCMYNKTTKTVFDYYQNDSIVASTFELLGSSNKWQLSKTVTTTFFDNMKVVHETNSKYWISESITKMTYENGLVTSLKFDIIETTRPNEHIFEKTMELVLK
jgi:hypothetical protein